VKYIVAGTGSMPLKEVRDALEDLPDRDTVVYLAEAGTRIGIGEQIQSSGLFKEFFLSVDKESTFDGLLGSHDELIAGSEDVLQWDLKADLLGSTEEVQVLALFNGEEETDAFIFQIVEAALDAGIRCRAFNNQMYDIQLNDAPAEPIAELVEEIQEAVAVTADIPTPDLTLDEIKALNRSELKAFAKGIGASPSDWRVRSDILDAVIDRLELVVVLPEESIVEDSTDDVDLDQLSDEIAALDDHGVDVETVSIVSIDVSQVLADLLDSITAAITEASNVLRSGSEG
jgi:hypothetical protein